jgi:hypothetical protein
MNAVAATYPESPSFRFKPHAFACRVRDQVIVLDLRKDSYFGLDPEQAAILGKLVEGWPVPAKHGADSQCPPASEALQTMLDDGLLTSNPDDGKPTVTVDLPTPTRALIDGYGDALSALPLTHAPKFLLAVLKARWLLRRVPLESIANRVVTRRRRYTASDRQSATGPFDVSRARSLVQAFQTLRPILFTSGNECLFDSLALIEFLAAHRIFPQWVFGVAIDPFCAHCWLQDGHIVVNDTPEYVCDYTPIMAL